MSADRLWFSLLGRCSGCNRPAVFERYSDRIVTKLCPDGDLHDSEACKEEREDRLKAARRGDGVA